MFRTLGMATWFGKQLYVSEAAKVFDAQGVLGRSGNLQGLPALVVGFADFAAASRRGTSV